MVTIATRKIPSPRRAAWPRLIAASRSTTSTCETRPGGSEVSQVLAVGMEWAIGARAAADPSRFFDVSYRVLLDDPTGVAREICEQFDYPFDPAAEQRMCLWLDQNPKGKHGPHRYDLAEFGLDPATINHRFASYRDWMATHIRPDPCRREHLGDVQA